MTTFQSAHDRLVLNRFWIKNRMFQLFRRCFGEHVAYPIFFFYAFKLVNILGDVIAINFEERKKKWQLM